VTEQERDIMQRLHTLQAELQDLQRQDLDEAIAALRKANDSLQRSHKIVGKMLALMSELF
jgi:hypothetical protein